MAKPDNIFLDDGSLLLMRKNSSNTQKKKQKKQKQIISDPKPIKLFIFSHTKGNVDYYKVNPEISIAVDSIDLVTGRVSKKEVVGYTYHRDLKMYKVQDKENRFEPFWVSEDHSLIAWDGEQDEYLALTPEEFLKSDRRLYLIKYEPKGWNYIKTFMSKRDIIIEVDPSKTEGGDFTVKDNYTFCTSDGVMVMDSIAMYVPMLPDTIEEVDEKMSIKNLLLSPANRELLMPFKHEMVVGFINTLKSDPNITKSVIPKELHSKVDDLINMINSNQVINAKHINELIMSIIKLEDTDINERISMIDELSKISFNAANTTIKLSDFYIEDLPKPEQRYKDLSDNIDEVFIEKYKQEIESGKRQSYAYDIITSGSRGNWSQFKQIAIGKGYIANVFGEIIDKPVKHSLLEGLTKDEYFTAAFGSRKGIVDTATNTAKSGYQTRKLIYLLSPVKLDPKLDDCGTDHYLELKITDESLAKSIIGRYLDNGEKITNTNYTSFIGKTIKIRSPIYCKAPNGKVCHKCYGDLYKVHHSKQIGIIAAQSMGERLTQLVLRTFHIGGIAHKAAMDFPKDYFKVQDDMISARMSGIMNVSSSGYKITFEFDDGTEYSISNRNKILVPILEELESVGKNLYRFDDNQLVIEFNVAKNKDIISDLSVVNTFLSGKDTDTTPGEFVTGLFNLFKSYGQIDLIHFEILASVLLFSKETQFLYRYSDFKNDYEWMSLVNAMESMTSMLHNLSFERFNTKLTKNILSEEDSKKYAEIKKEIQPDALVEQLLFFNFDDDEIEYNSEQISDII